MPSFFDIFLGHFLVKPAQSYNAFNEKMLDVEEIWPYISVVRVSLASSSYNSWRQRTPQFIGEVNVDPVAWGFEDWCGFTGGGGEKDLPKDEKSRIFPT